MILTHLTAYIFVQETFLSFSKFEVMFQLNGTPEMPLIVDT